MTSAASSVLFRREFGALSQRVRCCFPASSVFALIDEGGAGGAGAGAGARTRGGPPRGEGIWPRGRELLAGKRHRASPRAFHFPTGMSLSDERSRVPPPLRTAPSFTPAREDTPRTSADQRVTSTELTSEQHRSRGETAPKSRGDPHHTPISSQQIDQRIDSRRAEISHGCPSRLRIRSSAHQGRPRPGCRDRNGGRKHAADRGRLGLRGGAAVRRSGSRAAALVDEKDGTRRQNVAGPPDAATSRRPPRTPSHAGARGSRG